MPTRAINYLYFLHPSFDSDKPVVPPAATPYVTAMYTQDANGNKTYVPIGQTLPSATVNEMYRVGYEVSDPRVVLDNVFIGNMAVDGVTIEQHLDEATPYYLVHFSPLMASAGSIEASFKDGSITVPAIEYYVNVLGATTPLTFDGIYNHVTDTSNNQNVLLYIQSFSPEGYQIGIRTTSGINFGYITINTPTSTSGNYGMSGSFSGRSNAGNDMSFEVTQSGTVLNVSANISWLGTSTYSIQPHPVGA